MKNKLLKVVLLSLFLMFGITNVVHAEKTKICTTYNNYYFFNEIKSKSNVDTKIENNPDGWVTSNATYFPAIPENAIAPKNNEAIIDRRVCLSKNDIADGTDSICNGNTWTLKEFYEKELFIATDSKLVKDFKISENEVTSYSYRSEESKDTDGEKEITTYYKHGRWFVVDEKFNAIEEGGEIVNYIDTYKDNINTLVEGSFLPKTDLTMVNITTNPVKAVVSRTITQESLKDVVPFDIKWSETTKSSILSPALYQVKYRICEEKDLYNAKIEYVDASTGNPVADPYNKTGLEDGDNHDVTSPDIEGCVIKNKNDKEVTVNIEGKDFYKKVEYTCEAEKNSNTGSALIFIAWVVGIGALGYSVYYFSKLKKTQAE